MALSQIIYSCEALRNINGTRNFFIYGNLKINVSERHYCGISIYDIWTFKYLIITFFNSSRNIYYQALRCSKNSNFCLPHIPLNSSRIGNQLTRPRTISVRLYFRNESRGGDRSRWKFRGVFKKGANETGWMPKEEIPPGISSTGTGRTEWIGESVHRSGSEGLYGPSLVLQSAQALPASFSGLTSRRVPARGKRKKEQLRSRREMVRLKCGERAQWPWEWFYFRGHDNCAVTVAVIR